MLSSALAVSEDPPFGVKPFVQDAEHEATLQGGSWGVMVYVSSDAWLRICHQAIVSD